MTDWCNLRLSTQSDQTAVEYNISRPPTIHRFSFAQSNHNYQPSPRAPLQTNQTKISRNVHRTFGQKFQDKRNPIYMLLLVIFHPLNEGWIVALDQLVCLASWFMSSQMQVCGDYYCWDVSPLFQITTFVGTHAYGVLPFFFLYLYHTLLVILWIIFMYWPGLVA